MSTFPDFSPTPVQEATSLQLPYDRLKTPDTAFRAARVTLDERLALGSTAAQGDGAPLALAAAAALFYRYSGQSRIPLSLCVRQGAALEACALEIAVGGGDLAGDLVSRAAAGLSDAAAPYDPSAPLSVHVTHGEPAGAGIADATDLALELVFGADGVALAIRYNESLFDGATARRLLGHWRRTLLALDADATLRISALSLFSEEEQAWFDANCRGPAARPAPHFVHEEIARQARERPGQVAVRFNEQTLTYAELDRRANQLAHLLRARGAATESRVLVCLEPSLDVPVCLLAILKAGATYVPVNPAHPEFHIRAIVEDTKPRLILTQTKVANVVSGFGVETLTIDDPPAELATQPGEPGDWPIDRRQVAYVYYTSGTTGRPKGVAASHANMIHFVNVARDRYRITADDVIPAVAAFTFSISMFELTAALSVGGTLVVLERAHVLDAARMTRTLQEVTLFHIGPSLLKSIIKYIKANVPDFGVFGKVRHASSGGDMVPVEVLRDLKTIFSRAEVYVIYGCSEVSLMGCTWEVTSSSPERTYVGKPFAGVHLLVLDDDDNRVPIGAIGDVCFGGPGVVGGYVDPSLGHDRFFERDGIRYYRTGDRGRLYPDGNLELLGRRDFQIKLRGMRIELAEIDYHLRQAPGVRDGLVAAKQHRRGETVLVAYYVPEPGSRVREDELHAHMASRLPDYMVPVFYVALEALPLNYNLKVDRRALPELETPSAPVRNPPRTETEVALARIWCELLRLDGVGLDDNFMLLGGDSLLAMEMIHLVEERLGFRLDGMDVLRESLWILARIIDGSGRPAPGADDAAAPRVTRDILPVSAFYFGPDETLYGLYTEPLGKATGAPVLLCPPIGYEYMRCQFMLRTLAERLAEAGVPSLRFDFFGMADSLGDDMEASFARWGRDLEAALELLKSRSGSDRVAVFAMRLTATLALKHLPRAGVERWVLLDPVADGAAHHRELARMSREKRHWLLLKRNLKFPAPVEGGEELVGMRFSHAAIAEMRALKLDAGDVAGRADVRLVLSADFGAAPPALAAVPAVRSTAESLWYRSTRVTLAVTAKDILSHIQRQLGAER